MAMHQPRVSPLGAGLRSALIPGWGQVAVNGSTLGWALIGISVGLLAVACLAVLHGDAMALLARLADPAVLGVALGINLLVAGIRCVSAASAWWWAGGRNVFTLLLLVAVVTAPHAAIGWVGHETTVALERIFASPTAPPPTTGVPMTAPITTTSTTTTTVALTTSMPSTTTVPPTTTTAPPTTTTTTPPAFPDRLTFLLLGGDAGPGRPGLRTDTIMVATVDTASGEAAIFGIPRNFGGITFSDGTPFEGRLINEVYGWGTAHPQAFGGVDPGASAVRDVVEHLTGLAIDHVVLVDLTGFGAVIDAFGGVDVDVATAFDAPLYSPADGSYTMIRIDRGTHHLDGAHALAYARSRTGSDDYTRMGRQRCLLVALADQATPMRIIGRLTAILDAVATHVTTDIPSGLLPDLLTLDVTSVRTLGFDRSWRSGWTEDRVAIPDIARIRAAVADVLAHPGDAPAVVGGTGSGC